MKCSIVTVCFNSEKTIAKTIESVNVQDYPEIEHIFIDGDSCDNTLKIINQFALREKSIRSEKDQGIYDAMNKSKELLGGDVVIFLNSDDWLKDKYIVSKVMKVFKERKVDYVYGNVEMYGRDGGLRRVWCPTKECETKLNGEQIPHPGFIVKASVLNELDSYFDKNYKIAADLKQQLIIINKMKKKGEKISTTIACMSLGGASNKNIDAYLQGWKESARAYKEVFGKSGWTFTLRKVARKIRQCI